MKYLILSDIHGNLEALQSVLLKVKSMKIDKYVILGDLVGYGASPNKIVNRVKKMDPMTAVRGNHDRVASGLTDGRDFNYAAREAALWTRERFTVGSKDYVAHLPQGPVEVDDLFDIVHGSPQDEDYYIFQWWQAHAVLQRQRKQLTFFGHTHLPVIWSLDGREIKGDSIPDEYYEYSLEEDKRYLINPGSIGQPRDRNPKSSLAILDTDKMKIEFFRVEYNIKAAQAKIRKAELDPYLAKRLALGR